MKHPSAHAKLLSLLCLLLAVAGLALLTGLDKLPGDSAAPVQMADAFGRIVPGMTRAEDLPNLGFDAPHAQTLATAAMARRFAHQTDAGVQDCVRAQAFCTGYLFHTAATDVVLLVMDGRVVHKVFAAA